MKDKKVNNDSMTLNLHKRRMEGLLIEKRKRGETASLKGRVKLR